MISLCVTGESQGNIQSIAEVLFASGMQPTQVARRDDPVNIAFWHQQVVAASQDEENGPQAISNPGRLWEQLASDIFVANLKSKVWGWADARSLWLLDFWLSFEPRLNFVLVVTSPQNMLAQALTADSEFDSVESAMSAWEIHHQELLRFYNRNPQRCLLVDAQDCANHPQALVQRCNKQFKLSLAEPAHASASPARHSPLSLYLAHQLIQRYPQANSLQHEITATLTRLSSSQLAESASAALSSIDPANLIADFRQLYQAKETRLQLHEAQQQLEQLSSTQQDLQKQFGAAQINYAKEQTKLLSEAEELKKAKTQLTTQLATEVKAKGETLTQLAAQAKEAQDTKAENDLLLMQLHQVQEELEQLFLKQQDLQKQLDGAKTNHAKEQAKLLSEAEELKKSKTQLAAQLASEVKAKAEALTQHDAEAKAKTQAQTKLAAQAKETQETTKENELLLLQLHQVQEELENYFLQHQDSQRRLGDADQRWQRMLQRSPDYCDYDSLELLTTEGPDNTTNTWRIKNLNAAGRTLPDLTFKTVLESNLAGYIFTRQEGTSGPLSRWPGKPASSTELALIPGGPPDTAAQRLQAFQDLATSDWDWVQNLSKLLIGALDSPALNTPASFEPQALRQGLGNLTQVISKFPATLRFDTVTLKREQVNPDYEHLWLRLNNLAFGGKRWPAFEFRLSCANVRPKQFGTHPKLEFPEHLGQAPFTAWFDESFDDFGAKLELRFALPDAMDTAVWQRLSNHDHAFLLALVKHLPALLDSLQSTGFTPKRPWADWLAMAADIQRVMTLRSAIPAAQAAHQPAPAAPAAPAIKTRKAK